MKKGRKVAVMKKRRKPIRVEIRVEIRQFEKNRSDGPSSVVGFVHREPVSVTLVRTHGITHEVHSTVTKAVKLTSGQLVTVQKEGTKWVTSVLHSTSLPEDMECPTCGCPTCGR